MEIYLNKNNQLDCNPSDSLFAKAVSILLELAESYKNKIISIDSINTDMVTSLGNVCQSILLTKFNNSKNDLLDETEYPNIFIGEYSSQFIDVMMLLQELCQISWHLDTYPTLELIDKGIRQKDKEYFYSTLSFLHKQLHLLQDKIQKSSINNP